MTAKRQVLRVSADLALPLDLVTEATAIVATRGAGKSSASVVLVEESFALGVQSVVLDRTGVYWGLRSSARGDGAGLPIYVLGGPHGDVPLEPHAGAMIADLVVDSGHSFVLDLSDFSKAAAIKFAAAFLERLYDRKARARSTTLVVIDEAHFYAPQTPRGGFKGDAAKLMGAMEDVVGLGRSRGLGVVLTTQRTQALNKAVLDLIETLFVMRMLSPRARQAVKDWIQEKHEDDERGVIASLDSLPTGTAWVWSPLRAILERAAIRRIKTFDSYATPKPGEAAREARVLAPIDVEALGAQIAATVEQAKENDPAELRRRLRDAEARADAHLRRADEAERSLAERPATVEPAVVEVPVPTVDDLDKIWEAIRAARETAQAAKDGGDRLVDELGKVARPLAEAITRAAEAAENGRVGGAVKERRVTTGAGAAAPAAPPTRPEPSPAPPATDDDLGTGARHLLATLGHYHPIRLSVGQLALLARRKARGGAWNTSMKQLRDGSYVVESAGAVVLTDRGVAASGANPSTLSGEALRERWREALPPAAADIFDRLVEAYPDGRSIESLAEETERAPRGGSWNTAIATLVRNDLAVREGDVLYATAEAAGAGG